MKKFALAATALLAASAAIPQATAGATSRCAPVYYRPAGAWKASSLSGGPGLVLSGAGLSGMPVAQVLPWIRSHLAAPAGAHAGNVIVLKASGARYYSDDFYRIGRFAFVQEILIPPCASRAVVNSVAPAIDKADAVLFSGGDQANYVIWKGSALIDAVKRVYARGGIVGGGSAGLAIQGQVVFDSVAADRVLPSDEDVATPDAVKNPYEKAISFTTGFFDWPPLRGAITDTHFARRNRFGRLAAFMARSLRDGLVKGPVIYGVAVDEDAALLVDNRGMATMVERTREEDGYVPRGAYIIRGERGGRVFPGVPLRYSVDVQHLTVPGSHYDLVHKSGAGVRYVVVVDGARRNVYSRNPY